MLSQLDCIASAPTREGADWRFAVEQADVLHHLSQPPIRRYIFKVCWRILCFEDNADDKADDATQNALVALWRQSTRREYNCNLWLRTVWEARRAAWCIKYKRRDAELTDLMQLYLRDTRHDAPSVAAERNELRSIVSAALACCRERDRDVLMGRFGLNETLQAIGDRLRITREAVRQLERPALARLRQQLERIG